MMEQTAETIQNCLGPKELYEILDLLVRSVNIQFAQGLAQTSITECVPVENKNFLKFLIRINELDALISELPNFKQKCKEIQSIDYQMKTDKLFQETVDKAQNYFNEVILATSLIVIRLQIENKHVSLIFTSDWLADKVDPVKECFNLITVYLNDIKTQVRNEQCHEHLLNMLFITLIDAYCERLLLCIDLKLGLKLIGAKETPNLILQKIYAKKSEKPPLIELITNLTDVSARIEKDVNAMDLFARDSHIR